MPAYNHDRTVCYPLAWSDSAPSGYPNSPDSLPRNTSAKRDRSSRRPLRFFTRARDNAALCYDVCNATLGHGRWLGGATSYLADSSPRCLLGGVSTKTLGIDQGLYMDYAAEHPCHFQHV